MFLLSTVLRKATQPWAHSPEIKRPEGETKNSFPSNAELKNGVELGFDSLIRLHGMMPDKYRGKFTFSFMYYYYLCF